MTEERVEYYDGYKLSGFTLFGAWRVGAIEDGKVVNIVRNVPSFEAGVEKLKRWIDSGNATKQRALELEGR